jgi:hypothetical protein
MAKLSYFLVIADHNTGTFRTDEETLQAHFSDGTIFDTKTNEWEKLVEKNVVDRDVQLWNALQDGLQRVRTAPYDLRKNLDK